MRPPCSECSASHALSSKSATASQELAGMPPKQPTRLRIAKISTIAAVLPCPVWRAVTSPLCIYKPVTKSSQKISSNAFDSVANIKHRYSGSACKYHPLNGRRYPSRGLTYSVL